MFSFLVYRLMPHHLTNVELDLSGSLVFVPSSSFGDFQKLRAVPLNRVTGSTTHRDPGRPRSSTHRPRRSAHRNSTASMGFYTCRRGFKSSIAGGRVRPTTLHSNTKERVAKTLTCIRGVGDGVVPAALQLGTDKARLSCTHLHWG